ncbi:C-terminal of ATP synthase F0, B subunit [Oceaniovalibus guishaninsula JLT2003]|uniref:ATP synthase subunit b n=1 Tax=Oceaniovalibus guishaninsula JLT2003 TaxID=1231392 RepID=K2I9Q2_9RHOB|nr:F0F1 ATP synthase subunit B [Oceaniovalibus guishaninsula]EKE45670.1 C-terminal of ATP synthase F0, B subunit [Oceaniovalibus guishaninsula JLT2003]
MTRLFVLPALVAAGPALAATGPFFSLNNTNFVVLLGFIVFVGVLIYFKVFRKLAEMLDKRADGIRDDLAEARSLREEAQTLLASYERKHREVQGQADRIVAAAREDAKAQAAKAQADLDESIARRVQAARDQIASAEEKAVRDVRDRAIQVAVAAARDVLARQMDAQRGDALIDQSIETVREKLH